MWLLPSMQIKVRWLLVMSNHFNQKIVANWYENSSLYDFFQDSVFFETNANLEFERNGIGKQHFSSHFSFPPEERSNKNLRSNNESVDLVSVVKESLFYALGDSYIPLSSLENEVKGNENNRGHFSQFIPQIETTCLISFPKWCIRIMWK